MHDSISPWHRARNFFKKHQVSVMSNIFNPCKISDSTYNTYNTNIIGV